MVFNRSRALAWLQIATGLGILIFWALFFTVGLVPDNVPACYFAYEHSFPLADGVLALGLLGGGSLLGRSRPLGRVLVLPCAGGLIFLGLLDFSFNLSNGIYQSGVLDALVAGAINLWCIAFGISLIFLVGAPLHEVMRGPGSQVSGGEG